MIYRVTGLSREGPRYLVSEYEFEVLANRTIVPYPFSGGRGDKRTNHGLDYYGLPL